MQSIASPSAMCVKKWSRSVPWVLLKQRKIGADVVKTIYMILMFMERWGPAAGCGDCSLVDWKDSSEGAEETEVRRRFH